MAVYQEKARARIKSKVSSIRSSCNKGKKSNMGEADTREIVRAVLVDCLGWEMITDVTQEEAIKGGYCDFLIRYEGKPYAVIEVKKVSSRLRDDHIRQARGYAQEKGLEWVILTNGDEWQVHHLYYQKRKGMNPEPHLFHLFTTSFTDTENIKASERIEYLYLLSKEARKKNELEAFHDRMQSLSPQELTKRLLSKDVIDRIRLGIKRDIGVNVDNDELASRFVDILRDEAIPPNINYWINKLK